MRADGVVSATKPLDVSGTVVRGLRVRFEGGRVVEIEAESGADALRARCAKDEGASRLGELALVDREGRIGKSGITYFNTLLDENAASHLALGGAYATSVAEEDRARINTSVIHIDFMIGSRRRLRHRTARSTGPRCRCYAAGAGRSSEASRGGRAPFRMSCGSPRSANGTSITSKSRGATVAGNTVRASSSSSGPK